jgi:hypothetical protein
MIILISSLRDDLSSFKVICNFFESYFDNFDSFNLIKAMKVDVIILELILVIICLENSPLSKITGFLNLILIIISLLLQFFDLILASMFPSLFELIKCIIKILMSQQSLISGLFIDFLQVYALIIHLATFVIENHQVLDQFWSPKIYFNIGNSAVTRDD